MKRNLLIFSLLAASTVAFANEQARNVIYVNSDVTTHIVMPENLKIVDISTEDIVGNQCADNMIRIKPLQTDTLGQKKNHYKNEFLGTVTMVGERHVVQYDICYEPDPMKANAMYRVNYDESLNYSNPEVSMPESEMARLAWTAYGSKRKFHNIRNSQYGIKAEVYNIYTVGDYFFIDFVLKNQTKLPYDISDLRVTLTDKKETKATNFQTIELTPVYVLNNAKKFKKGFRQVIVLEKLTFPDEKVLNIEICENQISGRVVSLPIQYEDILNADCFDMDKINSELNELKYSKESEKKLLKREKELEEQLKNKEAELVKKYENLSKTNNSLREELEKTKNELLFIKQKLKNFKSSVESTLEALSTESNTDKDNPQLALMQE